MGRKRRHAEGSEDWGATETHDWGVPPPGAEAVPDGATGIASVSGVSAGAIGVSPLLWEPSTSTPLDRGAAASAIPSAVRWAMEDRRHSSRQSSKDGFERTLGSGDRALFVMDDGGSHCMIGRLVGEGDDGCVYCLVGRITSGRFEQLQSGEIAPDQAFVQARDISLCGVFVSDGASNVILVEHYPHPDDVPSEYRPPSPYLHFSD